MVIMHVVIYVYYCQQVYKQSMLMMFVFLFFFVFTLFINLLFFGFQILNKKPSKTAFAMNFIETLLMNVVLLPMPDKSDVVDDKQKQWPLDNNSDVVIDDDEVHDIQLLNCLLFCCEKIENEIKFQSKGA